MQKIVQMNFSKQSVVFHDFFKHMWLTARAINFEHNEYKHLNDNFIFLSLVTFWFRIFYQVKILIWFVVHQVQSMNMYLHETMFFLYKLFETSCMIIYI
jgi:hypothetical protein